MERINKLIIVAFISMFLGVNAYHIFVTKPKAYEKGMTDMLDLCYDLGEATIQSKVTGKTIVCAALTDKHPL